METIKTNVKEIIIKNKIIAVMRGLPHDSMVDITEALYRGGMRLVEITINQSGNISDTLNPIFTLREAFEGRMSIGAGTVMNTDQVDAVIDAGAEFILSPDTSEDVIQRTKEREAVSIPGALTPTEISNAHDWGADFVKLFPADAFPISYIKAVTTPLSHVSMLAFGNITLDNIQSYFRAGFVGAGVGSAIIDKALVAASDYKGIEARAGKFAESAQYKF